MKPSSTNTPDPMALPPVPEHQPSKVGLMAALAIGLIAIIALVVLLLFRSGATFGQQDASSPFFFFDSSPTPEASPVAEEPATTESPAISETPAASSESTDAPVPTPTPTPTPTPITPSPSGGPHTVTITDLGISQTFGGDTSAIITLSPGTSTTVYIQGSVTHAPNPPTCSVVNVSYGGSTTTPSCTDTPGFQIAASLEYDAVCGSVPAGNQTSWSASVTATDTDSSATTTGSAAAVIQC